MVVWCGVVWRIVGARTVTMERRKEEIGSARGALNWCSGSAYTSIPFLTPSLSFSLLLPSKRIKFAACYAAIVMVICISAEILQPQANDRKPR
jgi:hypothetical protein